MYHSGSVDRDGEETYYSIYTYFGQIGSYLVSHFSVPTWERLKIAGLEYLVPHPMWPILSWHSITLELKLEPIYCSCKGVWVLNSESQEAQLSPVKDPTPIGIMPEAASWGSLHKGNWKLPSSIQGWSLLEGFLSLCFVFLDRSYRVLFQHWTRI